MYESLSYPWRSVPGEQAIPLSTRRVVVLHTRTIPMGISAMLAFDPEPRVHIETTTSFGFPKGFFNGVETVEIQYDLNDPHRVYVCDERPVLARAALFRNIAIALAVVGALLVLMGL